MPQPVAIVFVLALPVVTHFLYVYHNKYLTNLVHVISTGSANGVSISITDRWMTLRNHYNQFLVQAAVSTAMLGILQVIVARSVDYAPLRFFGYIFALPLFNTVLSVTVLGVLNRRHLISTLRQAEAD